MGKQEARTKLQKELAAYREATGKLTGRECYQKAPEIMFTEAAADRISWLCDDEEMCALIEAGGTLKGCVASIIEYCRRDIGPAGEISEDDFRGCIKDYYRLPEPKALAPMEKQPVPLKSRSSNPTNSNTNSDRIASVAIPDPARAIQTVHSKPPRKEPTMMTTQLDMFGLLLDPKTPEVEGNPSKELVEAVQDLAEQFAEDDEIEEEGTDE